MTEKRFTFDEDVNEDDMYEMGVFSDNGKVMETIDVLTCLNNLHDENEQLKKEKESWKSDASSLSSLNSILSNELSIAQEQGYEPSKPYKEYIASIKTEYDKFWENKIKHMITD